MAHGPSESDSDQDRAVADPAEAAAAHRWASRQRLDEVFGEVLPTTTQDELNDEAATDGPAGRAGTGDVGESSRDRDLRRDVPPHHG